MLSRRHVGILVGLGTSLIAGCAAGDGAATGDDSIIGGVAAVDYAEAAIIDFQSDGKSYICSGAVIAPKVVLTAGHCVAGASQFFVRVGSGASTYGSTGLVFDYPKTDGYVDRNAHDVGLIFLDEPLMLERYPEIAAAPLPNGSPIINVGRMLDGQRTSSLWQAYSTVRDGAEIGAYFSYKAELVIQGGDSGGPDFAPGTHTIYAVNSGSNADGNYELLARTDLLKDWISQQIASHGGMSGNDVTSGPIPFETLQSTNQFEVASLQLNCRAGAGVGQPVTTTLFQGERMMVANDGGQRIQTAPDGKMWIRVLPPSLPGVACYVSAAYQFIQPRDGAAAALPPLAVAPGLFGSLALATHDGVVTGSVREDKCEFTVAGTIPAQNPIELALLTPDATRRARLQVIDDQNVLFSTSDLPAACVGVFDPVQLVGGLPLKLRANISTSVLGFRTIAAKRAYFHDAAGGPARPDFVIRGQTVQQLGESTNGYAQVRYTSERGAPTVGYLAQADMIATGVGGNL